MYRAGSLGPVKEEFLKYKSDLVGLQEVRWDGRATKPPGEYTFFYGKGNETHALGTGCIVRKRIISAIKRAEFISDRMSQYVILRGRWCNIIVLIALAPTEDKNYDIKDRFMKNYNRYLITYRGTI
jgi:exonuclease III